MERCDPDVGCDRCALENSFVKTGNPNTRGLPEWPAYVPEKDLCQSLGKTIQTTPVPRSNRFGVFQKKLDEQLKGL